MSDAITFRNEAARGLASFFLHPPTEPDALHAFFEETLARARRENEPLAVFVAAIGLVTYGRIDVAAEALRNAPPAMPAAYLVHALRALIPFPAGIDPFRDRRAALEWLEANTPGLTFDESKQRYMRS